MSDIEDLIQKLLTDEFKLAQNNAQRLYGKIIKKTIDKLSDDCCFFAEHPYIDKVYRDSYYHYYSSKLSDYDRDCIRISIFRGEIHPETFRDIGLIKGIQENYLGYFVLRPTSPYLLGRSLISPKALKESDFVCCTTKQTTTANFVKFEIEGFPHSSQDTETLSCAETTIWAIMEYFSGRYPDYRPVLPYEIISVLNQVSSERQIPSKGLNIQQISFAIKEFGFGTRIYSRHEYYDEFESLLSCYIESGIPVIVAIEDFPDRNIGHALLCIGHKNIETSDIDLIPKTNFSNQELEDISLNRNISFFDCDNTHKTFIFVDDNQPVYQKATLDEPAKHYSGSVWPKCIITHFIVPLYPKVYMEAYEAKNFITRFLLIGPAPIGDNSNILIRFYLASNRSFKDSIAKNETLNDDLKSIILEKHMPKFIWVAELSEKTLYKEKKANGIVIIDATEANIYFNKPLILATYQGQVIEFEKNTKKLKSQPMNFENFCIFEQNLKSS